MLTSSSSSRTASSPSCTWSPRSAPTAALIAVSGVRSSCETARSSAVLSASDARSASRLDIGVGEPLALLREREHARQRARDALRDLVVEHLASRAHQLEPADHPPVDVERQRHLARERPAAEHDARRRHADRRRRDAGGVDLREREARAADERAREPGEQRRLAFALVGLLRAAPLARGQLGDRRAREEQRREQQPDARVGRLQAASAAAARRRTPPRPRAPSASRRAGRRGTPRRSPPAGRRARAPRSSRPASCAAPRSRSSRSRRRGRAEHERGERIATRTDARSAPGGEAGHPARATGQGHARSLPRPPRNLPEPPRS